MDVHAILLCDRADVVCGSDGTEDRSLLLVVGETLACKVRASALRDLDDDGGFDIPIRGRISYPIEFVTKCATYRAASSTALAVDDEVTFYRGRKSSRRQKGKIKEDVRWPRYEIF